MKIPKFPLVCPYYHEEYCPDKDNCLFFHEHELFHLIHTQPLVPITGDHYYIDNKKPMKCYYNNIRQFLEETTYKEIFFDSTKWNEIIEALNTWCENGPLFFYMVMRKNDAYEYGCFSYSDLINLKYWFDLIIEIYDLRSELGEEWSPAFHKINDELVRKIQDNTDVNSTEETAWLNIGNYLEQEFIPENSGHSNSCDSSGRSYCYDSYDSRESCDSGDNDIESIYSAINYFDSENDEQNTDQNIDQNTDQNTDQVELSSNKNNHNNKVVNFEVFVVHKIK